MTVEELIVKLRTEVDNRKKEGSTSAVKENMPNKDLKLGPKGGVFKRPVYKLQEPTYRFNGKCFNCGSDVHRAVDCCKKKKKSYKKNPSQNKSQAHMAEIGDLSQDVDDIHLSIVLEVNMMGRH
ncbi:hypothetical protein CsSME_00003374 [Camellia sinensis var. sinensis]